MATMPVIDALDQCKIALQYVAERQSAGLTAVLDLLVERLDTAIGQAHAQLPAFSANNPPAHARETGRKSLPGAGLRVGEGVKSAH
jgi:hypothetical protein